MKFKLKKLSRSRSKSIPAKPSKKEEPLDHSLTNNLEEITKKTGNSSDIVIRKLTLNNDEKSTAAIIYVEGIVDNRSIDDFLIHSLINDDDLHHVEAEEEILEKIAAKVVSLGEVKRINGWDKLFQSLFAGDTIILVDGIAQGLSTYTKGGESRSIEEPPTEISLRGPREGFTESLRTNTALVRRRIKNQDLWVKSITLGKMTNTDVEIMYIDGLARDKVVQEVCERLKRINIDSILESGYIEELIEDQSATTFPTVQHTERPDSVAGNLLEGRVAIFIDGTPFVLIVPAVFIQFFQSVDDYYSRADIATSIRMLRILIFLISLFAPAVYVAATTFHQEMIPTQLLIVLAAQREAVPFPAVIEAILMELTFEILREAGVRMPKAVGQTISIVGALVIGQAAVQAGIVSPAMVIIVAITAIASFATPSYSIAISARLIRFGMMIAAAAFGFYGIILSFIILLVHLCSLRSFGVPYMAPMAPFIPSGADDTIVRLPWWGGKERPRLTVDKNSIRQGENQKPKPPSSRTMK
ncbi:spore germination protein [Alteribacillus bidgolensis]|uniref:Spore germination protein KA n=1 Tax=Alteribacillus bidgolensis TaxID=930129 RepID=A0A1G8CS14_9BACI|nr:spore germination protein [Alteribacillus bidgolensis]SDH47959.1 spore germination protein KA [Alteribacillus bidgolensis]